MNRLVQNKIQSAALGALLVLAFAGCDRDKVKVYHVESGDSAAPAPPPAAPAPISAAMPATMPAGLPAPDNSGLPQLKYTLPDGWKEKEPTQMRVASFDISEDGKSADVSVIPLSGMGGGDFANVNRWRGQAGLPPLADGEIEKLAEKISVGGQPADLYDIAGDTQRILAVIFHRDDTAWFFKVTGDPGLVEKQKPAFVSFLSTVQFGAPAAPPATDMSQLPPMHPPVDGMNTGVPVVTDGTAAKPAWTVPAGWNETAPSQFLVAKFIITGADGAQAAVNVSSLADDGGGLLANVNRWRGQLGLAPLSDEGELAHVFSSVDLPGGGRLTLVDFTGTDSKTGKPARLAGCVVPQNGQTWFYKLMGDETVVAQQKDALIKFIQSAHYPDAH
jgi:hypothetical protein